MTTHPPFPDLTRPHLGMYARQYPDHMPHMCRQSTKRMEMPWSLHSTVVLCVIVVKTFTARTTQSIHIWQRCQLFLSNVYGRQQWTVALRMCSSGKHSWNGYATVSSPRKKLFGEP